MSHELEKFPWVEWRLKALNGIEKNIRNFAMDRNFGIVYDDNIARYTLVTALIRWCQLLFSTMRTCAVISYIKEDR